jgi:hypothetical protein
MTVVVGTDHEDSFQVGEPVRFVIAASDPDATPPPTADGCNVGKEWGDGTSEGVCIPGCAAPGYGPWDPPPPTRGEVTYSLTHVYDTPGEYTATFTVPSSQCSPYGDLIRGSVVVTVVE